MLLFGLWIDWLLFQNSHVCVFSLSLFQAVFVEKKSYILEDLLFAVCTFSPAVQFLMFCCNYCTYVFTNMQNSNIVMVYACNKGANLCNMICTLVFRKTYILHPYDSIAMIEVNIQ